MNRLALLIGWLLALLGLVSTGPDLSIPERRVHGVVLTMDDAQEPLNTGVRSLFWFKFAKAESDPSSVIQERCAATVNARRPVPSKARMATPSETSLVKEASLPASKAAIGILAQSFLSRVANTQRNVA